MIVRTAHGNQIEVRRWDSSNVAGFMRRKYGREARDINWIRLDWIVAIVPRTVPNFPDWDNPRSSGKLMVFAKIP